jgi:hypothetical protein
MALTEGNEEDALCGAGPLSFSTDRRGIEIAHVLDQRDSAKSYWEGFSPN